MLNKVFCPVFIKAHDVVCYCHSKKSPVLKEGNKSYIICPYRKDGSKVYVEEWKRSRYD